jgi:membrane protease YdiL (CAAX protease family)
MNTKRTTNAVDSPTGRPQARHTILFFILAFLISWAAWAPLVIFSDRAEQLDFLLMVGAYGPFLAAVLTSLVYGGWRGLWRWLKTIFRWRLPVKWYLVAIFINFLFVAAHLGLYLLLGGKIAIATDLDRPWYAYLIMFPVVVLISWPFGSGLGEETGWRGFALSGLLQRFSPLTASVILAVLWGLWHIPPLFFMSSWDGSAQSFLLFIYVIPLSILMTWVYCGSRGSALTSMLMHTGGNIYSSQLGIVLVFDAVLVGAVEPDFTILKTVYYTLIAAAVLIATRGRLGYPSAQKAVRPAEGEQVAIA